MAKDDPCDYHQMATRFLLERFVIEGYRTLQFDGIDWWAWSDGKYHKLEVDAVKDRILLWLAAKQITNSKSRDETYANLRAIVRGGTAGPPPRWVPITNVEERDGYWLAFTNGVLNMSKFMQTGKVELVPATPRWFSPVSIPYRFDATAEAPVWEKCISEWVNTTEERNILQEFAGYCLLPDCRFEKALFLQGSGGNGKSKYCEGIEHMMGGTDNVGGVELSSFGKQFALYPIKDKLVNIAPETKHKAKLDMHIIKGFITGDIIPFEAKWENGFQARNRTKLMIGWNEAPVIDDASEGTWRRMMLVNFPNRFDNKNPDVLLGEKLRKERAGIMNWALVGLTRLLRQGKFTESDSVKDAIELYKMNDMPETYWLRKHCDVGDANDRIKKAELYAAYMEWAMDGGHKLPANAQFSKEVRKAFPSVNMCRAGAERVPCYTHLKWSAAHTAGNGNS